MLLLKMSYFMSEVEDLTVSWGMKLSSYYHIHVRSSSDKAYIFLVDKITKPKFSNCPNVFEIGLFR